ncbi:MAG: hypothetical protein GY950_33165, partial [bacterium]|nr:hypothetical protein [bacterium]
MTPYLDLDKMISKEKLASYHKEFDRVKNSKFRQRLLLLRMHKNRVIQSTLIIL